MVANHFLYHIDSTVVLMISIAASNGEAELTMGGRSAHQCLVAIHSSSRIYSYASFSFVCHFTTSS